MDLERYQKLIKNLRAYDVQSSDQLSVHVRPRHYGESFDLLLDLYFDPKFYALVGVALHAPTAFIRETSYTREADQKRQIGRTAQYIAVGLLEANKIALPDGRQDKIVVTALFPTSQEGRRISGITETDGITLSYHLDANTRTPEQRMQKILEIAKNHRRHRL